MRAKLVIAFVVAFVVADVFLVAAAMRHVNAPPPSGAQPAHGKNATGTTSPTTADPTTADPTTGGATPIGLSQRPEVLLSVAPDGTILRADAGDCRGRDSAGVEVSTDGGSSFQQVFSGPPEILRVTAASNSDLVLIETDAKCRPAVERSTDGGASWSRHDSSNGFWHLDPHLASTSVHTPRGAQDIGCVPVALAPLGRDSAVVGCQDGSIHTTVYAGVSWQSGGPVAGLVSLDFSDKSQGLALAHQPVCASAVLSTSDFGQTWQRVFCLEGDPPQALAVNADTAVAQVDGSFWMSSDKGQTWRRTR